MPLQKLCAKTTATGVFPLSNDIKSNENDTLHVPKAFSSVNLKCIDKMPLFLFFKMIIDLYCENQVSLDRKALYYFGVRMTLITIN